MAFVATQTASQTRPAGPVPSIPGQGPATRPNLVAVGTMVWLSSELMFFAALPVGLGFLVLIPVLSGSIYASYRDIFVAN